MEGLRKEQISSSRRESYEVQRIRNVTVMLKNNDDEESERHICLSAIVYREVKIDSIIGLPSFLFYNLPS